jgi:hypothetical protein
MKKVILFILLSISFNIYSQNKSFDLGIKTGGGLSFWVGGKGFTKNKSFSYGLTNGLSFVYNSKEKFFLQTELLIERKTIREVFYETDNTGSQIGERKRIVGGDAIELFIMPGFKTKGKAKFLISGGVFVGMFFNDHLVLLPSDTEPEKEVYNRIPPVLAFDFGLSTSIGFQYPITEKLIFTLENRFNVSIENFVRVPFDFANNNIMLGFAYRFSKNN